MLDKFLCTPSEPPPAHERYLTVKRVFRARLIRMLALDPEIECEAAGFQTTPDEDGHFTE